MIEWWWDRGPHGLLWHLWRWIWLQAFVLNAYQQHELHEWRKSGRTLNDWLEAVERNVLK
jgi:hypothetical protein